MEETTVTGVFAMDKPEGFTSFDVVAKLRGLFKTKKIGHGGTLDPMATGVLPIYIGKATRAVDLVPDQKKRYLSTVRFGTKTDTGDITGEPVKNGGIFPKEDELRSALSGFLGKSSQLPPMYSAVKVDGRRLYDLARAGKTAERKPRDIEIELLNLLDYDEEKREATIDVLCSKGCYIRSLAEDIAEKLSTEATLSKLQRIRSGPFLLEDCRTFEMLEQMCFEERVTSLLPVERVFLSLSELHLDERQERLFLNGVRMEHFSGTSEGELLRVYGSKGIMIALAKIEAGRLMKQAQFV